jgi:hypothetical protein
METVSKPNLSVILTFMTLCSHVRLLWRTYHRHIEVDDDDPKDRRWKRQHEPNRE